MKTKNTALAMALIVSIALAAAAQQYIESLKIGGGYGTTGIDLDADGAMQLDGTLTLKGDVLFVEKADHSSTPSAGNGYLWVKNTTPSTLMFTDDAGSDTTLGSGGSFTSSTITSLTQVTPVSTDFIIGTDASDGDALKKFDIADILGAGGGITDGDTLSTGLTFPNTGLHVLDSNGTHDLILSTDEDMSTDNTLQFNVSGASKKLTLTANATISGTNSGDQTITLSTDATGSGTGTVAMTLASAAITNKTNVTAASADTILITDASDSNNLKEAPLSDLSAIVTGLADSQISDTLTASLFVGSGSSTNAVDLATAEVAGDLPLANIAQIAQSTLLGRAAGAGTGDVTALSHLLIQTLLNTASGVTSTSNSVAWNSDNARIFTHTLTENTTIAASSGTPFDGQLVLFAITQAAGSYTLAWNAQFAAGEDYSDTIPAMSTTNGNLDFYLYFYSSGKTKFILLDQMAY